VKHIEAGPEKDTRFVESIMPALNQQLRQGMMDIQLVGQILYQFLVGLRFTHPSEVHVVKGIGFGKCL
jgi:hypothetical protein